MSGAILLILFFAFFFAIFILSLLRPESFPKARRRKVRAPALVVSGGLMTLFLVLFMLVVWNKPEQSKMFKTVSISGNPYLREAAARNLACELDSIVTVKVKDSVRGKGVESEVLDLMRRTYTKFYEEGNPSTRQKAILCLKVIPSPGCVDLIETALVGDDDKEVRKASADALGEINDSGSVSVLVQALIEEEDAEVLSCIEEALVKYSSSAVTPLIEARCNTPGLSGEKCKILESTLAEIGPPALQPLIDLIGSAHNDWVSEALVRIGNPALVPLKEKIKYGNLHIRFCGTYVLFRICRSKNPGVVDMLLPVLQSGNIAAVAPHYGTMIELGIDGSEWILMEALLYCGTIPMAEAFLNCGNALLDQAARNWVAQRPWLIIVEHEAIGPPSGPQWGG